MVARLFVYGTLRPGNRPFDELLSGSALHVGPATLRDHALYGAGLAYPYLVEEQGRVVVGEIVAIPAHEWPDVAATLDQYEGTEYVRAEVLVETIDGTVSAHTYRALVDPDPSSLIVSGDWMDP